MDQAQILANGNMELTEVWTAFVDAEGCLLEAVLKQQQKEPLVDTIKLLDQATVHLSTAKSKLQAFRNSLIVPS